MNNEFNIKKIDDYRWEIPKSEGMRVPGMLYADAKMLQVIKKDRTPIQVKNVAYLPGIVKYSLAMPDMHWGYGFCIGGVAATDPEKGGVISPGGIGFDINCGVRLVRTNLTYPDIRSNIRKLLTALFRSIPCGVGSTSNLKLSFSQVSEVLKEGAKWAVKKGFGLEEDLERTEENGAMSGANPEKVSQRAYKRGNNQLGTLGSGNHFLEIDEVEEIYAPIVAKTFGLFKGQIAVTIHTGSRGLGYQVCDDYLAQMRHSVEKYNISLPDRQLSCAPLTSFEGKDYFSAMAGAANYAWTNRQMIMHWTRKVFKKVLNLSPKELGMQLVYDVCHNIGKFEQHTINGKIKTVFVHRKGATRAFPAHHPQVPRPYQEVGQPVLVPGDMGTNSYVMVGTNLAMEETWGSTCHGAGRVMSRTKAKKVAKGRSIEREMADKGILVMAKGRATIAEEMPEAYKDIDQVVNIVDKAGLSKKVAKLRPIAVIKG